MRIHLSAKFLEEALQSTDAFQRDLQKSLFDPANMQWV